MGGVGGVILFVFIVRMIMSASRGGSGGKSSNVSQNTYGLALWVWLPIVISLSYVASENETLGYILFIIYIPLLVPSLFSFIFSYFGHHKLSYYLGKWSFVYFGQDKLAGGLYRGVQAVSRQSTFEQKNQSLIWLKSKFLNSKGKIYSGDMIMFTIISAHIDRPNDPIYLGSKLSLLKGIGSASVHQKIGQYASRLALAPVLARRDWIQMQTVSQQWNQLGRNSLTKLILSYSDRVFNKRYSRLGVEYLKLLNWRRSNVIKLLQEFEQFAKNKRKINNKMEMVDLWQFEKIDEKQLKLFETELEKSFNQWCDRAEALGCWDRNYMLTELSKSVKTLVSTKLGSSLSEDDDSYYQLEQQHKSLNYVAQNVQNRLNSGSIGCGIQNYMDWMTMKNILKDLSMNEEVHAVVFTSIHNLIWNWVAALWNDKKERSLVHFIATDCMPHASKNGLKDFHKLLLGITLNQYK